MKKLTTITLVATACVISNASVSFNVGGGNLLQSDGTSSAPNSTQILFVASTTDASFGAPSAGDSLSSGSFFSGTDDLVLFRTTLNGSFGPGTFSFASGSLDFGNGWDEGDALAIYWFPELNSGSTSITAGTSYNSFTLSVADSFSQAWFTPADGTTGDSLNFQTTSFVFGGDQPISAGIASLTVVPEPSFYAGLAGIAILGYAVYRRRR